MSALSSVTGPCHLRLLLYALPPCFCHLQVAGLDVGWHQQLDMEWDPRTHRYVLQRAMYPGKPRGTGYGIACSAVYLGKPRAGGRSTVSPGESQRDAKDT